MKKQLKTLLGGGMLLLATALPAQADNSQHNSQPEQQISFSVDVSRQVQQDTMRVILFAQESGKTLKAISPNVTKKLNAVVEAAKKRNIQTGATNRKNYLNYDKQNKPSGWTDYAEITLESQDFTALSELIAAVDNQMAVQNLVFTLSDEQKQRLESEMTTEALQAFKQKAELISRNLQAESYRILNLNIGNSSDPADYQPIYYTRKSVFSSAASDESSMQVQSGQANLKIQVSATIYLKND
ncbi:SIMPL domain-containing protein [Pasteurella testudinis]|uniref:SIMPL domain-containing protein n=1 Tax=Pasteurella testudinis TaxID=761 RepID=UPI004058C150